MTDRPRPVPVAGDLVPCWSCGKGVSPHALFCHACGSVQPPADLDAFARLKLPACFDLETDAVARQQAGFLRILDPARFAGKGMREQGMVERHRAAVDSAARLLADPLTRAKALLALNGLDPADPAETLNRWEIGLAIAADAAPVDRLAAKLSDTVATTTRDLAEAFRLDDFDRAAALVGELEGLAQAQAAARRRRATFGP